MKKYYYDKAKENGYAGSKKWIGSTVGEWKTIFEELTKTNDDDIPLNVERIDPNNIDIHRIRFSMEEVLGDKYLTEDNVDYVKTVVSDYFQQIYDQTSTKNPKYQISLLSKGKGFSTHFTNDLQQLFGEINQHCDNFARMYDSIINPMMDIQFIEISYITNYEEVIMGAYKTITAANDKWLIVDTATRKNCVFVALYTSLHFKDNINLLYDSTIRITDTKKWKSRLFPHIDIPTVSDLDDISKKIKLTIYVYNNIFEHIATFANGKRKVCIQIYDNHAKALIDRKHLPDNFKIPTQVPEQKTACMQKIRPKKKSQQYNTKIVAWDIETFMEDDEFVVYCSGLAWGDKTKQFFTHENNLQFFIMFIKDNITEFSNFTFYAHNGGKFDVLFLLRDALLKDNEIEILGTKLLELNNALIGLSIKYKGHQIHFKDSYSLFQSSLKKITKDMKVNTSKGEIDHDGINVHTYNDQRDKILEYHRCDCVGLLECLMLFSKQVYDEFQVNITDCYTAASLSKKIILSNYLNTKYGIYRLDSSTDEFIRRSYQGGRCECFMLGDVQDVYYYDFTSLYPYTGTQRLPVGKPKIINETNITNIINNYPMSFVECDVIGTKEMLRDNLPLHGIVKDSKFIFPYINTPTRMVLFSQEIRKGLTYGYQYKVIKCIAFDQECVLRDFFTDCFQKKKNAKQNGDESLTHMWKIIINSGYGFWGYTPYNKDTLKMYKSNGWLEYLKKNRLKAVNSVKPYTFARVNSDQFSSDTNVAIASAITSYARVLLHSVLNDVKKKGFDIYYCDTDSIMCNLKLSDHSDMIKKYRKDQLGDELGTLKNELGLTNKEDRCFDTATIVGCKMYSITSAQCTINKLKGYKNVDQQSITTINNGGIITQQQTQFLCNKSDFLRFDKPFNLRLNKIEKKFQKIYTKGVVCGNCITPLTI